MLRRNWFIVVVWFATALTLGLSAPNLTQLAADSFGRMLPDDAESMRAADLIGETWPFNSHDSAAVICLQRDHELTPEDQAYAHALVEAFRAADRPADMVRILGPHSEPEVAQRLLSPDGTTQLIVIGLRSNWVAPRTSMLVDWMQHRAGRAEVPRPEGLEVIWSGDAALGSAYMDGVQTTLDRASILVVVLLLIVLLTVYRSFWLALVPLVSIGCSLIIARSCLAIASATWHWEVNPLVELFLIAVLFGSGTDLTLLLTWRYAESWDPDQPERAGPSLWATLRRVAMAMLSSAATLILALSLLHLMEFKLFSQTGPSIAFGMAIGLIASLTLSPALIRLLSHYRPQAFRGMRGPSSGFWDRIGSLVMRRPRLCWAWALGLILIPASQVGSISTSYNMLSELPEEQEAIRGLRVISQKYGPGEVSPLTVVVESTEDLRQSDGLYLIDDLSRRLAEHRDFGEVRSATQPLGTPETLSEARLNSRIETIRDGLNQIRSGAEVLSTNFYGEAAKIQSALTAQMTLQSYTGLSLLAPLLPNGPPPDSNRSAEAIDGTQPDDGSDSSRMSAEGRSKIPGVQSRLSGFLKKITEAARGTRMIAEGAGQAVDQLEVMLSDPAGRRALDHLLLTSENLRDYPELSRGFATYFSPDGTISRIEVGTTGEAYSAAALDMADELIERSENYADDFDKGLTISLTGPSIVMADVRRITESDLSLAYILLPAAVFLAMLVLLRDFGTCLNLVVTMLLTYAFTLSATDWVVSHLDGTPGLDWKVKFFVFVLLIGLGVDYNIFLVTRLNEESQQKGLREGIRRAIGQTGALITSAAAITVSSFATFLVSPLESLRELGLAMVIGISLDALVVRPILVPCGHWLMFQRYERLGRQLAGLRRVEDGQDTPHRSTTVREIPRLKPHLDGPEDGSTDPIYVPDYNESETLVLNGADRR